ncbi:hypothetical protein GMMP15_1810001 [Candidatus Magnetomoraceae bacterium gMMP-15]
MGQYEGCQKIYHTSDTKFQPNELSNYYNKADIIIYDCETSLIKSEIHSHYDDLITLNSEIKAKMLLWHYQDNVVDKFEKWQEKAIRDGFKVFVKQGEQIIIK